jgi:3-deoxy-7-phosphoheptulonate synthase
MSGWLILELDPGAGLPDGLEERLAACGRPWQLVEAGWARFVRLDWPQAGRRDGDEAPQVEGWLVPGVRRAFRQDQPFVLAGRPWRAEDTRVEARGHRLGGGGWQLIAGPCSVESRAQMLEVADAAARAGAGWLRGGAFKPRTSPYHFQGLGLKALEHLRLAADEHGLAVITELLDPRELAAVAEHSDVIQVGSRNAQNFPLLKELGRCGRPVLLKRGFGSTLEETVLAAEYVMSHGNPAVALCERGIRTFESATRFTFDVNALPWLKARTHLPVVADPSHATGDAALVPAVARAALAAGADGIMLEVHPRPAQSISDAGQALSPRALFELARDLDRLARALGRLEEPAPESGS